MFNIDFGNINVDEIKEQGKKATEPQTGLIEPGVYLALIENMFFYIKNDTGSVALIVDLLVDEANKETGEVVQKKFRDRLWIVSGKEKGNKTTFTNKNGKEVLLPAWTQVGQIMNIYDWDDANRLKQGTESIIEDFGRKINVINLNVEPKECYVVVGQYEDDFGVKNEILTYLNSKDENLNEKIDKWNNRLEKRGVRKVKQKEDKPKVSQEEIRAKF